MNQKLNVWKPLLDSTRHQGGTPKYPGIYCFIEFDKDTKERRVIYVGKSENLFIRLKLYHKVERVYLKNNRQKNTFLYLKVLLTDDYHRKEVDYIKRLTPVYNVCHNPIIRRKIVYQNGQTIY